MVWTADGRPHPAVTRTLQYGAVIASSRNGQHLSAKSLHRRWEHEVTPKGSHGSRSSPESFSAGRVALRRHHRQSFAPQGTFLKLTQQFLTMTMTLTPQRAACLNLKSHRASCCSVCPRGWECRCGPTRAFPRNELGLPQFTSAPLFGNLHLENCFEDNGVWRAASA